MVERQHEQVFLITGASSGIGAATARYAARAGYHLVLAARSLDALHALAQELGGDEQILTVRCDVTRWEDQQAMVEATLNRFGRLDIVFANAGFIKGTNSFLTGDDTPDDWRDMILTNVYGTAITARTTLPELVKTKGHLFITGSVAGKVTIPGELYSVTKWATAAMAESIRKEVVGQGVHVTLVEPGKTATSFWGKQTAQPQANSHTLLAEDIAQMVLYVAELPTHISINEIVLRPVDQEI
ncbi:MAG TPA: short-chain dehydrogenase [Ktedonobacter sp.]|nr:short-chain dehydrogenase [Ktedonobacter sp.]